MTWIFQNSRQSVLLAVLFYWIVNTPYLPDGDLSVLTAVLAAAAVLVVAATGLALELHLLLPRRG
jgi:hypothetical protein